MKINLNDSVKVKLTDWGKEIFYNQYNRVNKLVGREVCKPRYPEEDENGYTEFQLWCFMELYGEHMGMTLPNVIEPLEIVYESEKGEKNQPEIVRCKDCKFYSPMNRETKTGICSLLMHQNFGDNWFCAGAERREE